MAITLILEALRNTALTFAALFPIINPVGVAPIFLSLTSAYPESIRSLLARKIALYGLLLLGGSLALGSAVLAFFGISLPIIQLAGGFVLANTGWTMLNQKNGDTEEVVRTANLEDALQRAFYPLTLPLTVGPGSISVAIAIGAQIRQQSTTDRIDNLPLFLGAFLGMALVCSTLWVCYRNAGKLAKFLGPSGTNIVARLSAFLLLAMGVQIMWNGAHSVLGSLLARGDGS
jgi:multiple antibiotic resistance protein